MLQSLLQKFSNGFQLVAIFEDCERHCATSLTYSIETNDSLSLSFFEANDTNSSSLKQRFEIEDLFTIKMMGDKLL